ncbi:dihydrofolate reductase family protein [Sediminicola luteus]|uniref:Diacylglycerol kinase n=1 Tax=Sediminicola luteus TaxID=319238 RepID=A0A2A4G2N6_9FLAO|nr:dihydrofolate reductase family protein [Sediminicola luteus]PCE62947.1 diacylglycerol kinase [Sediminicola luteus]
MEKKNIVYIATSLDGYIADSKGGLDWLHSIPNPNQDDMGFLAFMNRVDALVMGRNTFETVIGFDVDWPYTKPVFVLSNSLNEIPQSHADKAFLVKGALNTVLKEIHDKGFLNLYIDGGTTIQNFLRENLIDELIISRIPVLLGGGVPLFGNLPQLMAFDFVESTTYLNQITQCRYKRKK